MLLVNFPTAAGPAILRHAAWRGLTLADIVCPIFLLIVGISTSLALDGRRRPMAWVAVVRRGAMLFAIGVALNWCLRPELDWGQLRWTGVLQRIAIVYLACAATISMWPGALIPPRLAFAVHQAPTFL